MDKYIPYEKLSKKARRERDAAKRGTWGGISPITRKPENSKTYNRRKAQSWKKEFPNSVLSSCRVTSSGPFPFGYPIALANSKASRFP